MDKTKTIVSSLIDQIGIITDEFYQHSGRQRFLHFDEILKQLTELADCLTLEGSRGQYYLEEGSFLSVLTELSQALEQKDETLVADLLQYDLLELLTKMKEEFV